MDNRRALCKYLRMVTTHSQSHHSGDAAFQAAQTQWLCESISNEMSWHVVELFIRQLWNGDDINQVIHRILALSGDGIDVNQNLLLTLRATFTGNTNIFRRPDLFRIVPANYEKAHKKLKKLEHVFGLKPNHRHKIIGMPSPHAQYRRACITKQAYTLLACIQERYKIQYGRGHESRFKSFICKKILADVGLKKFLFRGKTKDEEEQSRAGTQPYETFREVRNTARRLDHLKRMANPVYRGFYEKLLRYNESLCVPT